MRYLTYIVLVAVAGMILATGCRTSEAGYQKAYEKAVSNPRLMSDDDSTIFTQYRREASLTRLVIDGDTLEVRTDYLRPIEGFMPEQLRNYNIAVGRFKQLFNARSQQERMHRLGYTGTIIAQTREPLYYVIAAGASTPSEILPLWRQLTADTALHLPQGMPQLLHPAGYLN